MLRRKIDKKLIEWKNRKGHKPIVLTGARQIGKTTSIEMFGKKNYSSFIEINFHEFPEYKQIFSKGYSAEEVVRQLSMINPDFKFIKGKTLIFFDEIQDYMDALTSLKFFSLDGNYDVICSGSGLGVKYKNVTSVPVGFKEEMKMYSLDFEEFLWALNYKDNQIEYLKEQLLCLEPLTNVIKDTFNDHFTSYILTGGMPKIVKTYVENKNFSGLLDMQKEIINDYDNDIVKYTEGLDSAKIKNVYRHIAPQLSKENHKFQITKLGHGARSYQYLGCNEWLEDSGVINTCYCLNDLSLPLKGNENQDNYRLYFADSSLLIASLDDENQKDLRVNKNFGVYKGALYENIAAEALKKQGYDLYFYKSDDNTIELDYLIRVKNNVVPIEIKSKRGKAKSLNAVIKDPDIKKVTYGFKFGDYNIGYSGNVATFPYFTLFLLKDALNSRENTKLGDWVKTVENEEEL